MAWCSQLTVQKARPCESTLDLNGNHMEHSNSMEGIDDQENSEQKCKFTCIRLQFNTTICALCAKMKNSILSRGKGQLELYKSKFENFKLAKDANYAQKFKTRRRQKSPELDGKHLESPEYPTLARPRILTDKQEKSPNKDNAIAAMEHNLQMQNWSLEKNRIKVANHYLAKMDAQPTNKDSLLHHHYQDKQQKNHGFMEDEIDCVFVDMGCKNRQNTMLNNPSTTTKSSMEKMDVLMEYESVIHQHFCERQNDLEKGIEMQCCRFTTGCANSKAEHNMGRWYNSITTKPTMIVVDEYPNAVAIPGHWGKRRMTDFVVAVGDLSEFASPRKKRKHPTVAASAP